ncbi:hypothetical protein [Nonomuraea jabiensis]|uniref:Transposase n=1 Tax=Nonomuraea jabiensis TaxID=882448 RepID=A0A7W9FY02_9ACTN|nr:hypothetical protein [Nonomuraea jabiensis]MBB5773574.1 hypothetical protein [Nonomuraea jabiensis]
MVAPSTVWESLEQDGLEPAPERASTTWADFFRSQADALLACDFVETVTLNGQRRHIPAVIDDATRRVRVLGTTHGGSAVGVGRRDAHRNSLWQLLIIHLCLSFFSGHTVNRVRRGAHRGCSKDSRCARAERMSKQSKGMAA